MKKEGKKYYPNIWWFLYINVLVLFIAYVDYINISDTAKNLDGFYKYYLVEFLVIVTIQVLIGIFVWKIIIINSDNFQIKSMIDFLFSNTVESINFGNIKSLELCEGCRFKVMMVQLFDSRMIRVYVQLLANPKQFCKDFSEKVKKLDGTVNE